MKDQTEITVAVSMTTYNHEEHIGKAIMGVVSQQTNFRVKLYITEDKSPDNTAEVCQQYHAKFPEIIDLEVFKKNKGANPNWVYNLKKCMQSGARYIATCEGDDYWIDPLKLQKQVDFLEANPDYGMVHTDLHEYSTVKNTWRKNIWKDANYFQSGDIFNSLLIGRTSMIYLCTVTFRKNLLTDYLDDFLKMNLVMGDIFLYLVVAAQSKIGYLPETTAVRQLIPLSATQGIDYRQKIRFLDSGKKLLAYIKSKFDIEPKFEKLANESLSLRYLELYFNCNDNSILRENVVFKSKGFIAEKFLYQLKSKNKYFNFLLRKSVQLLRKSKFDYTSKSHRTLVQNN